MSHLLLLCIINIQENINCNIETCFIILFLVKECRLKVRLSICIMVIFSFLILQCASKSCPGCVRSATAAPRIVPCQIPGSMLDSDCDLVCQK